MVKLYQADVEIIENKHLTPVHKLLACNSKQIAAHPIPGKFITIDLGQFFRRPFCIAGVNGTKIDILYRIIGPGTEYLSKLKKGDKINVFGPLGTGYSPLAKDVLPVFVSGGTGIASLRYLAQTLNKPGLLFYGAKTKKEIVGLELFKKKKWKIILSTDDGSLGSKCNACDLFNRYLSTYKLNNLSSVVFACGPKPMMKGISAKAKEKGMKCYVSLEEKMACGVGACRGCVVKVTNLKSPAFQEKAGSRLMMQDGQIKNQSINNIEFDYKACCKDGPVFDSAELLWD